MRNTIVYLIRHAETVTENGIRNTNEDSQSINEKEYCGKRIAVVSHGGSIKFFLLNWCNVNKDIKLVYNNEKILNIKSPCLLKLTFSGNELIELEQI